MIEPLSMGLASAAASIARAVEMWIKDAVLTEEFRIVGNRCWIAVLAAINIAERIRIRLSKTLGIEALESKHG